MPLMTGRQMKQHLIRGTLTLAQQIEETVLAVSTHAGEFVVKTGARSCLYAKSSPYPFLLLYTFDPIKPEMDSYGAQ